MKLTDISKPSDKEFLLAEYNRLCAEIAEHMREATNCINFTIVTSGAIWAWFAANSMWEKVPLALAIPSVLTILWGLRFWALQKVLANIGSYIKATEEFFVFKQADRQQADRQQADRQQADRQQADRQQADRQQADRQQADRQQAAHPRGGWEVFLRPDGKAAKKPWHLGVWGAVFFSLLLLANGLTAWGFWPSKSGTTDKKISEEDLKTVATEVAKAILSKPTTPTTPTTPATSTPPK